MAAARLRKNRGCRSVANRCPRWEVFFAYITLDLSGLLSIIIDIALIPALIDFGLRWTYLYSPASSAPPSQNIYSRCPHRRASRRLYCAMPTIGYFVVGVVEGSVAEISSRSL